MNLISLVFNNYKHWCNVVILKHLSSGHKNNLIFVYLQAIVDIYFFCAL